MTKEAAANPKEPVAIKAYYLSKDLRDRLYLNKYRTITDYYWGINNDRQGKIAQAIGSLIAGLTCTSSIYSGIGTEILTFRDINGDPVAQSSYLTLVSPVGSGAKPGNLVIQQLIGETNTSLRALGSELSLPVAG